MADKEARGREIAELKKERGQIEKEGDQSKKVRDWLKEDKKKREKIKAFLDE